MAEVFAPLVGVSDMAKDGWRLVVAGFARPPRGQSSPVAVEFDYREVYRLEDRTGNVVGMFHTHPDHLLEMSRTDVTTMRGWVKALGKPLLCVIVAGGRAAAWQFDRNGKARPAEAAAVSNGRVFVVFRRVRS